MKESATISSPVPGNTLIEAVPAVRQCAAVRIARAAMIVPEQDPLCVPLASFMLRSTTGSAAVEQLVPLTIAVCPSAPHAADTGVVGAGDGDVEGDPPPPHAAQRSSAAQAITLLFILVDGMGPLVPVGGVAKPRPAPGRQPRRLPAAETRGRPSGQ